MNVPAASDDLAERGLLARAWAQTASLRAGIIAGALFGALFGGVGGRIVMRLIALIDTSTDGAKVDFATVGEITVGGSFTLLVLSTIAGVIGGVIYIAVRRWLPRAPASRGVFFGLLMMFGPGVIAVGEVDLQIVEPALPIFAMFIALIVLYGICVARLADRLHSLAPTAPSRRTLLVTRGLQGLLAVGICFMAVLATFNVYDHAGSCLSADDNGGCAARAPDR